MAVRYIISIVLLAFCLSLITAKTMINDGIDGGEFCSSNGLNYHDIDWPAPAPENYDRTLRVDIRKEDILEQRNAIIDAVVLARMLNATFRIPQLTVLRNCSSLGPWSNDYLAQFSCDKHSLHYYGEIISVFMYFEKIYNEDIFEETLQSDIRVMRDFPKEVIIERVNHESPVMTHMWTVPPNASIKWYVDKFEETIKSGNLGVILYDFSSLPWNEILEPKCLLLKCKARDALRFRELVI